MSDNPKIEISELITTWLSKLGELKCGRSGYPFYKISKNMKEFREKADALLESLIAEGHDPDEIRGQQTINKILKAVNPAPERMKKWPKKYKADWATTAENQTEWWKALCTEKFGSQYDDKIAAVKEVKPPEDGVPAWNPPKGKLDLEKFQGFETNSEMDYSFVNQFKENKDGK